jgi:hypothetical protein
MLKDMVESLGHVVIAEAGYLTEPLELAKTARRLTLPFSTSTLEVPIPSRSQKAVAARGLPFNVSTAYGIDRATELFDSSPVIQKPFLPAQLQAAIAGTIGGP